jgi:hypothetical protein
MEYHDAISFGTNRFLAKSYSTTGNILTCHTVLIFTELPLSHTAIPQNYPLHTNILRSSPSIRCMHMLPSFLDVITSPPHLFTRFSTKLSFIVCVVTHTKSNIYPFISLLLSFVNDTPKKFKQKLNISR